jgi:hypothetical protein
MDAMDDLETFKSTAPNPLEDESIARVASWLAGDVENRRVMLDFDEASGTFSGFVFTEET